MGLLAVVSAGYLVSWYQVYRQRRRFRIVTHRQQRRLLWWRRAFIVAVMGAVAGISAAFLSRLLVS